MNEEEEELKQTNKWKDDKNTVSFFLLCLYIVNNVFY